MAGLASGIGRDMVGRLAARGRTVVAAHAVIGDALVVEACGILEGTGVVAQLATAGTRVLGETLDRGGACGDHAKEGLAGLMAIGTAGGHASMVELGTGKGRRVMAFFARIVDRDVVGRLAARHSAVMAAGTARGDAGMVETRALEGGGAVTQFAAPGSGVLREALDTRGARGDDAEEGLAGLMAVGTAGGHAGMVELRAAEGTRVMAFLARIVHRDVVAGLADGRRVVMAIGTAADDTLVVEAGTDELGAGVAAIAFRRGRDMVTGLARRFDTSAFDMATGTLLGRTLEDAARMAGLALDIAVRILEDEAGLVVIELGGDGRFGRCRTGHGRGAETEAQQQGRKNHNTSLPYSCHAAVQSPSCDFRYRHDEPVLVPIGLTQS